MIQNGAVLSKPITYTYTLPPIPSYRQSVIQLLPAPSQSTLQLNPSLQPWSPPFNTAAAATPPDQTPLSSDCGLRSSCSSQSNPPTKTLSSDFASRCECLPSGGMCPIDYTLKDGGWIDPQCAEIHASMVATRDEASQSGCPLTDEELSRIHLGEAKYYIRGFGVGPRPSSLSSQSSSNLAQQELQKVRSELELLREERQREREEYERREEQQRQRDEQRQREFDELKAMMMRQMNGRDNV